MNFEEGLGVLLPKREIPYIYDGREQPRSIKHVYVNPDGYFPRMSDITAIFGKGRRDVDERRMKREVDKFDKFSEWYIITNPTEDDVYKAIENVNLLYRCLYLAEDNCELCNALDEALFKEKCWLVTTNHNCRSDKQNLEAIDVTYSYSGIDYIVNMLSWLEGASPHKGEDEYANSS